MADRQHFRELAKARLKTVKILFENNEYDTAAYLIGYVVELALKATICNRLNLEEYPETGEDAQMFKTHRFDRLLMLSGMSNKININGEPKLFENWSELTEWRPDVRYLPLGTYTKDDVERKIKALEEDPYGLLTWIKKRRKW